MRSPAHRRASDSADTSPAVLQELANEIRATVAEVLGDVGNQRIAALFNRGNRGDGVIHEAGRQLFRSLGLVWTEVQESSAPPNLAADVLLVSGCGAFSRRTPTLPELVQRYASTVERVVILPSSFGLSCAAVRSFVDTWSDRYTVLCRERRSFDSLTAACVPVRSLRLTHDLAFYADVRAWAVREHTWGRRYLRQLAF